MLESLAWVSWTRLLSTQNISRLSKLSELSELLSKGKCTAHGSSYLPVNGVVISLGEGKIVRSAELELVEIVRLKCRHVPRL